MERPIMSDSDFKIMQLKSELFDLQSQTAQIRLKMEERIKELNQLLKERDTHNGNRSGTEII